MIEKFICAQCGKKDFKECIIEDGKKFCCAVCVEKYKKTMGLSKKEGHAAEDEQPNVCKFC